MAPNLKNALGSLKEVGGLVWSQASVFVKVRLIAALVLITMASALTALGPVALKLVVDGFTGQTKGKTASAALLIFLYVASQWLARTIGEVRGLLYARAERRMSRTLSERLFAHVMQLPLRYHLERQTGAVTQTLQNGLQGYQLVLHTLVFTILPVATELGTIVLVLNQVGQPEFLLLFCCAIVCYATAFAYAARQIMSAARRASAAQVNANSAMTDTLLNLETVKYFAAETVVQGRIGGFLIGTENEWVNFYRRFAVNGLLVATIYAGFLATTFLYAAREVQLGRITVGTFVLLNTYMLQIVRPVELLGYAVQSLSQGIAYLEQMLAVLREKAEDVQVSPDAARTASAATVLPLEGERGPKRRMRKNDGERGAGELDFRQVYISYRAGRSILKDVSFHVPAGKTLGIVGPSGSGKSTLVRLLTRLVEPDSGLVLLDGVPISDISLAELRGAIAVVPQDTVLFNDTLAYNIAFGRHGSSQCDVEEAARLAHLHEFIRSLPDGYDTRVGERGVKLSGGEKQRVAIARAAIKRPRIYVFDEATSSLDSQTEGEILRNLEEISRHSTTLVIAHRLSTVVHADEIVVLDGGVIAECGTHAMLLRNRGRYAGLWEAQQSSPNSATASIAG